MSKETTTVSHVLSLIREDKHVDNFEVNVKEPLDAMDAFHLRKNGFHVPDELITYNDEDIAYDPDFDDGEWSKPLQEMTPDELEATFADPEPDDPDAVTLSLKLESAEEHEWLAENAGRIAKILQPIASALYAAEQEMKDANATSRA